MTAIGHGRKVGSWVATSHSGSVHSVCESQEVSNVRALQIFERKVLSSISTSGKIFEGDLRSSDSVAKFATQKSWVF